MYFEYFNFHKPIQHFSIFREAFSNKKAFREQTTTLKYSAIFFPPRLVNVLRVSNDGPVFFLYSRVTMAIWTVCIHSPIMYVKCFVVAKALWKLSKKLRNIFLEWAFCIIYEKYWILQCLGKKTGYNFYTHDELCLCVYRTVFK